MKGRITQELGIPCYSPANSSEISVDCSLAIPATVSTDLLGEGPTPPEKRTRTEGESLIHGTMMVTGPPGQRVVKLVTPHQAGQELGLAEHRLRLGMQLPRDGRVLTTEQLAEAIPRIHAELARIWGPPVALVDRTTIEVNTVRVEACAEDGSIHVSWDPPDDELGKRIWHAADVFSRQRQ